VSGLAGTALLLGGCPAPGITENPLDAPEDGPPVVSVCYAPAVTDLAEEVEPVAQEACAVADVENARLRYWKKTHLLNDCPLFKKSRIAYFCMSAETAGSGGAAAPAESAAGSD
jgi:hypothetical protein